MKLKILTGIILISLAGFTPADEMLEVPNVLIIGDSISIGYMKPLKQMLQGRAQVVHNPGNAAHSRNGLAKLDGWLGDTRWDVIHFNHGLHDLKYVNAQGKNSNTKENAQIQVPLEEYRKHMTAITQRLKQTGARLVFATTTPYPEGVRPLRLPADAVKYNDVALEIMKKHGVMVNDLYTFALPQLDALQKPKNVHFTPAGSKALAKEVERHILKALGQQKD